MSRAVMNDVQYQNFVKEHRDEIADRVRELDNFEDAEIAVLKQQLVQAINIRKHMPVIPMLEVKELMVGLIAIQFIEQELDVTF
jgi:hypothetical protein